MEKNKVIYKETNEESNLHLQKFNTLDKKSQILGKILFLEKKGFRIKTKSKIFGSLPFEDIELSRKFNTLKTQNEFCNLKNFYSLKSDFLILSISKFLKAKNRQRIQQIYRNSLSIQIPNSNWIQNKGSITDCYQNLIFLPYSKIAPSLKNKNSRYLGSYSTMNKESFYEPYNEKYFPYFLINEQKRKIWLIQSQSFFRKLKFIGSFYSFRYPYGYLVGIDGIPVLLHRNQLFFSCRKMKDLKNIFHYNELFIFEIFAKYNFEKRTNVKLYSEIAFLNKVNKLKKFNHINFTLRNLNKKMKQKDLYKK